MPAPVARILYLHFASPGAYPPIAHGAHILGEGGADVRIVGTRPLRGGDVPLAQHNRVRVTLVREGTGVQQKLTYVRFTLIALWFVVRYRPSWIYVSDFLAAPAAVLATALSSAGVLYHEHDTPSTESPSFFVRLCLRARRRIARSARCTVAPSSGRAAHLRDAVGVRSVYVVMNCPRVADIRSRHEQQGGPLRLLYHGTIVPQRLPLALADAIAELDGSVTLTLAGWEPPGAEGHISALLARASRLGGDGAIVHVGVVSRRQELMDLCAQFDAGLALMPMRGGDANMRTMAGASNKAFDYLACGVPLLVSDLSDWRAMFVDPGYARAVDPDDPTSLAVALRWLGENRHALRLMGEAGRRRVGSEWNYERQFAPIREILLGAVSEPASDGGRRLA